MRKAHLAVICISIMVCSCGTIFYHAKTGYIAAVQESLANGAQINWKGNMGNTPLMVAASEKQNAKMVELLCQKGTDLNIQNIHGATALILAACYNRVDSAQDLIKYKADKSIRDMWGNTALDYAEQNEYTRLISLLRD